MIYPIAMADLREDSLREAIYPDLEQTFYWSDDWDPDFYVALARAGFISISIEHPDLGDLLLPELQKSYAVLEWANLHLSGHLRKLERSGRLEQEAIELRIGDSCQHVINRLVEYHGSQSWLCEPYRKLISKLPTGDCPDFAIAAVELWSRRRDELVAGELGYTIGNTYTSLSGFCSRDEARWRHFGSLQLVLLARELQARGYAFWNLGHPHLAYKHHRGARVLPRHDFLRRWWEARSRTPARALTVGRAAS